MRSKRVEELLRCGPGEPGGLAFLESRDDGVLLSSAQVHERLAMSLAAVLIELRQPATVEILQIGVGAGERQIDVVEHSGIARARLARCPGHEPLGEGRNRGGIVAVEERAKSLAVRLRV